jgi:hypothetical protein
MAPKSFASVGVSFFVGTAPADALEVCVKVD